MSVQRRIGLIVPSSNVTIETELPELFRRREAVAPERFTSTRRGCG
jgi:maleate isomerase